MWCTLGNAKSATAIAALLWLFMMPSGSGANHPSRDLQRLRILQWNAGGLSHEKRTQLLTTLTSYDVDVFIFVEANLSHDSFKFHSFGPYYTRILPKSRRIASGILVGVKKDWTSDFHEISNFSSYNGAEIIKLDVWKMKRHFKIYGCYSPPANTKLDFSLLTFPSKTILCGDFNGHSPLWDYRDLNSAGKAIEDLLITNKMELLYNNSDVKTYLHYNGNSTNPDLTLASVDIADDAKRKVIYDPGSGHRMIITDFVFPLNNQPKDFVRNRWNFAKANWKGFTLELESIFGSDSSFCEAGESVDRAFARFSDIIFSTAKKWIPRGKQVKYKPFWNENFTALKEKASLARITAEQSRRPEDTQIWRRCVATLRKEILSAKRDCFSKFITKIDYRKDGKKVFNYIKKLQNKTITPPREPLRVGNRVLTYDKDIANAFNSHYCFKQRLTRDLKTRQKNIRREICDSASFQLSGHEIFHQNFRVSELSGAIGLIKNGKSPGSDNFHPEFLKNLGNNALSVLLELYNYSWNSGVPAIWRKAIIVPIHKKNKPSDDLNSYRPISLTSILSKVMERMIKSRLTWYLEANRLLTNTQAGFRKFQSTNQQVIFLSQAVKDALDERYSALTVFVDFEAAFDRVWRVKCI